MVLTDIYDDFKQIYGFIQIYKFIYCESLMTVTRFSKLIQFEKLKLLFFSLQ